MDLDALEYTKEHYNRHAGQFANTSQALQARRSGPGAPLKTFHNTIKRRLINRCAPWPAQWRLAAAAAAVTAAHN